MPLGPAEDLMVMVMVTAPHFHPCYIKEAAADDPDGKVSSRNFLPLPPLRGSRVAPGWGGFLPSRSGFSPEGGKQRVLSRTRAGERGNPLGVPEAAARGRLSQLRRRMRPPNSAPPIISQDRSPLYGNSPGARGEQSCEITSGPSPRGLHGGEGQGGRRSCAGGARGGARGGSPRCPRGGTGTGNGGGAAAPRAHSATWRPRGEPHRGNGNGASPGRVPGGNPGGGASRGEGTLGGDLGNRGASHGEGILGGRSRGRRIPWEGPSRGWGMPGEGDPGGRRAQGKGDPGGEPRGGKEARSRGEQTVPRWNIPGAGGTSRENGGPREQSPERRSQERTIPGRRSRRGRSQGVDGTSREDGGPPRWGNPEEIIPGGKSGSHDPHPCYPGTGRALFPFPALAENAALSTAGAAPGLPREVVDAQSLGVLKARLGGALSRILVPCSAHIGLPSI